MVFTKEDLMDGRVWVGGWAAADADAERQLQAQGDGRPKASQGSQGSQDLHAHRLGWAGALGATGVPRGLRGSLFTSLGLVQYLLVWCNARWARRSCQVVESKGCWVAAGGKAGKNLHPAYPFDRSSRVCSFKTGKAGSASGCAVDRGPLLAISRTRGRWGHTELDCVALSHLLLACWLPLATRRWRLGAEAKTALVVCVPSTVNILRMPGCGWRTLC